MGKRGMGFPFQTEEKVVELKRPKKSSHERGGGEAFRTGKAQFDLRYRNGD